MIRRLFHHLCLLGLAVFTAVVLAASAAHAAPSPAQPSSQLLGNIIGNLTGLARGLAFGVATFFATLGCVRYMMANGDPMITEKGKNAFKAAVLGYALALLAEPLLSLAKDLVS
ncbi:hypothetical protein [Catellatospora sp. NPDC049609]|uniref:hypothetical protein n=1 Tax=Catellatospora sp. NPDC049609 TaxID=3155505 RepID=UPI00341B5220